MKEARIVNELNWQFVTLPDKTFHSFLGFKGGSRYTEAKGIWSNVFRYIKVRIFWKFVQYTIHWDKTQMLQKFIFGSCTGIFHWRFRFVFVKAYIFFNKMHGLFNFIFPFEIKVTGKPHLVLLIDLWFLSCNKKF